jgi:hypothetical protein
MSHAEPVDHTPHALGGIVLLALAAVCSHPAYTLSGIRSRAIR